MIFYTKTVYFHEIKPIKDILDRVVTINLWKYNFSADCFFLLLIQDSFVLNKYQSFILFILNGSPMSTFAMAQQERNNPHYIAILTTGLILYYASIYFVLNALKISDPVRQCFLWNWLRECSDCLFRTWILMDYFRIVLVFQCLYLRRFQPVSNFVHIVYLHM